jgi:hypothetical protein
VCLRIDIDLVEGVLLDDGWRTVASESFEIDTCEFYADEELVGNVDGSAWVRFTDPDRQEIFAPLSAIRAVCLRPDE